MSQLVKLSEVENGDCSHWDYKKIPAKEDGSTDYNNITYTKEFLNKYVLPYIKYSNVSEGYIKDFTEGTELPKFNMVIIEFLDGSNVYIKNGSCLDMYYDVNAEAGPNKMGYDRYTFAMCFSDEYKYWSDRHTPFIAWGLSPDNLEIYDDREKQLENCKKDGGCTRLLQLNGFDYPKDYPYKL